MRRPVLLLGITIILLARAAVVAAATPDTTATLTPSLSELRQTVLRYFQAQPDYRSGDLITQDEIAPLMVKLRQIGLPLPDAKQILEKVPAKDEFLAVQLHTPNGWKFMREISGYKGAYDRLDRLSRLPYGKQTIRDLIRGPDGYKMIEYMTTTPGGKELGNQISNAPQGEAFNGKTGRIYTAKTLLLRLEQSRAASLKTAKK